MAKRKTSKLHSGIKLLPGEVFKDVVNYEGLYKVSNKGRLINCAKIWYAGNGGKREKNENLVNPHYGKVRKTEPGYNHTTLSKNRTRIDIKIATLVAQVFIPNPHNKKYVNHIDGNKQNDYVENLEWSSAKENTRHAFKIGLMKGAPGSLNSMAKLTEKKVLKIRELFKKGYRKDRLAVMYKICLHHVGQIVTRRRWTHI